MTAVNAARDALKAAGENVLVLNAGDVFQGSLFFTTYSGAVEAEMMNRIGLDAMVYGNHEFDLGPEPLAKFIEAAEFPVLSGNVDVSADNLLAPLAEDHLVLEIGGEKVAILGGDDARHRRDLLARPDGQLPRAGRLPDRQGDGARGGGRRQGHPAQPPRRRPATIRGRRGGAGHRR